MISSRPANTVVAEVPCEVWTETKGERVVTQVRADAQGVLGSTTINGDIRYEFTTRRSSGRVISAMTKMVNPTNGRQIDTVREFVYGAEDRVVEQRVKNSMGAEYIYRYYYDGAWRPQRVHMVMNGLVIEHNRFKYGASSAWKEPLFLRDGIRFGAESMTSDYKGPERIIAKSRLSADGRRLQTTHLFDNPEVPDERLQYVYGTDCGREAVDTGVLAGERE